MSKFSTINKDISDAKELMISLKKSILKRVNKKQQQIETLTYLWNGNEVVVVVVVVVLLLLLLLSVLLLLLSLLLLMMVI